MGMLAGMLGGTAASSGAAAGAGAGTAAGTTAGTAAASSPIMGALQKVGQQRIQSMESGQGSERSPNSSGNGLEGLYNVQAGAPTTSNAVAPVLSPEELLKNRNLSIGGGYGRE